MFVTDEFVFLHLPKTGGTFTQNVFKNTLGKSCLIGKEELHHQPLNSLSPEYEYLPKFAFTRNPWDWYVSWYHFQKNIYDSSLYHKSYFFAVAECKPLSFKETTINLLNMDTVREKEIKQYHIEEPEYNNKMGRYIEDVDNLIDNNYGFYSMSINKISSDRVDEVRWGKVENLTDDLVNILSDYMTITESQINEILKTPKVNTSKRTHYKDYYDQELIDLVYEKDKVLIDYFGYTYD